MSELLPCPFCGGEEITIYGNLATGKHASCRSCGLQAPTETGVTNAQAVEYWNTRASPAPSVAPSREWQDIETAPKDGTRIILCWDDSATLPAHVELGKRKGFAWANTYGHPFQGEPTHWMPLPAPPVSRPHRGGVL